MPIPKSLIACLLGIISSQQVLAQGATVSSPVELTRRSEHLKPGEWVWAPQIGSV